MKRAFIYILTLFLILLILFVFLILKAQSHSPKLKNPLFALLVNTLLTHDVEETGVALVLPADKSSIFLDSRTKEEFQISHIPGAIWVGYEAFDIKSVKNIPHEAKIISYCSIGYRSEIIARKLKVSGYQQVSNLYGGIFEWVNRGGKLEDHSAKQTDTLHVYNKIWGIWTSAKEKVN